MCHHISNAVRRIVVSAHVPSHFKRSLTIFGTGKENNPVNTNRNKKGNVRITCLEERSRNHYCREKAVSVIYSVCLLLDLLILHANRVFSAPYFIVICGVSGSILFFKIISFRSRFSINKLLRFSLKLSSYSFIILRRILRDIS